MKEVLTTPKQISVQVMGILTPTAYSLIYRLRKKGIAVDTRQRTIFLPYGEKVEDYKQALRLLNEFHINIQFIIT